MRGVSSYSDNAESMSVNDASEIVLRASHQIWIWIDGDDRETSIV